MYEVELKELGLTDNEIKVYLVLLRWGLLNPTKIAEKTGLHRSYIYDTLERLLEKGIINTLLVDNKKHYQAVDPKALREIFELKLRQLDSILPSLSGLFKLSKEETRVELHKGKRVYRTLIKELVSSLQRNDVIYLFGIDEDALETVEPIYLKQYFAILQDKDVKEKIIIAKGARKLKRKNLNYRELDDKYIGESAMVIHKDRVFIFVGSMPMYLISVKSEKVAETYRKQFELLWGVAK